MQKMIAIVGLILVGCGTSETSSVGTPTPSPSSSSTTSSDPAACVVCSPGDKGEKGDPGAAGSQGVAGAAGATGPAGAAGPQGSAGPQGVAGPQGEPGAVGPKGATGAAGATGPAGSALEKSAVYVRETTVNMGNGGVTSATVKCTSATHVVLSGGCVAGPRPSGVSIVESSATDPDSTTLISGWKCQASNFSGADSNLIVRAYCLRTP